MSDLQLAEKACRRCGESKSLIEFYVDNAKPDGHRIYCRDCERERVRRYQAKRRDELGEAAWLEYRRETQRRYRDNGRSETDLLQQQAWNAADARLRYAHREEFAAYYREERYDRGLNVD